MNRQLNLSSNYEKEIETSKEKAADNSDRQNVGSDSTRQNEGGTPNRAQVCRKATQEWNKIKTKSVEEINNIIKAYLTTPFNLYNIQTMKLRNFVPKENLAPSHSTIYSVEDPVSEIPPNAVAQKNAANAIETAKKKLLELKQIYNITTDPQFRCEIYKKIEEFQTQIQANKDRIVKLKRNT
ncbi:3977_t:CDS:2, partial [Dentiscutata erythropus]